MQEERYARQVALPGFGTTAQQALGAARVLVIGAGGLGSTVIPALAAAGVGHIGIVDDDQVELSNLHRQYVHSLADVGRSKSASAAASIAAIDPAIDVSAYEGRLDSSNALALFAQFDVVVDGSDNFPTRYLANDAAAITGIPLVWGAVSQYGGQAGLAWAERGPHYRDLFPTPPPAGSVLSCADGGVLPTTVAVIGSIMATETIKVITGVGTPLLGRVTTYDALSGGFREIPYARDPAGAPVTELDVESFDYLAFCGVAPNTPAGTVDKGTVTEVTATDLAAELESGRTPVLLDVREEWEAAIATLPGAVLVPLGHLEEELDGVDPDTEIVAYCHHGIRSASALELLRSRGFASARHLSGGIDAWARAVDPSMERY